MQNNLKLQLKIQEKPRLGSSGPKTPLTYKIISSPSATQGSSTASLKIEEKELKIMQLETELANLSEVLNLHRQAEQDLNKKLMLLESSKTKENVNFEYFKNVFMKFLVFRSVGSDTEEKQLENILLDLLHLNKQEREELLKATQSKNSFLGLFSLGSNKDPKLTGSYIVPMSDRFQRTPRILKEEFLTKKVVTEVSFSQDLPLNFENASSTRVQTLNKN